MSRAAAPGAPCDCPEPLLGTGRVNCDECCARDAVAAARNEQAFLCRDCGLGVRADEDGCCSTCGRDCAVVLVLVDFPEDEPDLDDDGDRAFDNWRDLQLERGDE